MEGHQRNLDGKANEQPQVAEPADCMALQEGLVHGLVRQNGEVKGVQPGGGFHRAKIEDQHNNEHQHTAHQGKEKKLDGCIFFLGPTPYPDKEIHGQQHQFPEYIEEEKVQGAENSLHTCIQKEKEGEISPHVFIDVPRGNDTDKT